MGKKPSQCQNNQFLWFSEVNPNVKESINLTESFVFYPTAGCKLTTADVLKTKEYTQIHIQKLHFLISFAYIFTTHLFKFTFDTNILYFPKEKFS